MSIESKREHILSKIRNDPLAVDFQISAFISALKSYRHDTVLRPFPPGYILQSNEHRDYSKLNKHVDLLLKVTECTGENLKSQNTSAVELLYWILEGRKFKIKTCSKDKYSVIEALTAQTQPVPQPNYVFEVIYNSVVEDKFQEKKSNKNLLYAYHGSRMENFYSILNHGLQQNMTKNALFGDGIYLSGELSVSMPYSPNGSGWDMSIIGQKLSCISVCEIIDDPSGVKCQEKEIDGSTGNKSRSHIAGSMGGEIPEKYYVVRNNELLRTKYLLVYAEKSKPKNLQTSWIYQHKVTLMIICYTLFLLFIGLYNSKTLRIYINKMFKNR